MRFLVSGKTGFVGRHVLAAMAEGGHELVESIDDPMDGVIHLAWAGLPNYESEAHYANVAPQLEFVKRLVSRGVTNITVAGTCLEGVPHPPHYALAKRRLFSELLQLPCDLKWTRLWYLWGQGQRLDGLVPRLFSAIGRGETSFRVIDGEREFVHVRLAAEMILNGAKQTAVTGIIDCCEGAAVDVGAFCNYVTGRFGIDMIRDYPMPLYEPKSFHGNPDKLLSIS